MYAPLGYHIRPVLHLTSSMFNQFYIPQVLCSTIWMFEEYHEAGFQLVSFLTKWVPPYSHWANLIFAKVGPYSVTVKKGSCCLNIHIAYLTNLIIFLTQL